MKMLVAGGAGFIGSNFIFYMRGRYPDLELICVDKLTYAGNLETLAPLLDDSRFRFYQADITDGQAMEDIFSAQKPDVLVNFAAESHVDRSIDNPSIFLKTNIAGVQVLLDACRKFGVKRFHQVSTDEVYGDLPLDRPDLMFTEESPMRASSPYSASKAAADLLCGAYYRTYGTPVTISRCSNNYGPYQFPEKLIPLTIINALENKSIPVYGSGLNVRDWLHVEDHCAAIDLILRRGRSGRVYNVGGHGERRNIDIVTQVLDILGRPHSLIRYVDDRKGHDLRYAVEPARLKSELGWNANMTVERGLAQTVQWYLDHQKWWRHILDGSYLSDGGTGNGI